MLYSDLEQNNSCKIKKPLLTSQLNESYEVDNHYRYSYAIVGLVTFVGDSARGILFPALWPLCQVKFIILLTVFLCLNN
jgi:hypothetical protein